MQRLAVARVERVVRASGLWVRRLVRTLLAHQHADAAFIARRRRVVSGKVAALPRVPAMLFPRSVGGRGR